ncbi:MAG: hypothetical protein AAF752_03405, partial [Bacteroidota bacterium]
PSVRLLELRLAGEQHFRILPRKGQQAHLVSSFGKGLAQPVAEVCNPTSKRRRRPNDDNHWMYDLGFMMYELGALFGQRAAQARAFVSS